MANNNTGKHGDQPSSARDKDAVDRADRGSETDGNQADDKAQHDIHGKEEAAENDDSKTVAREKDTSRTAAIKRH